MAVIVDTSVIIELERRKPHDAAALEALVGEAAMLASVTVSELLTGIYRVERSKRRRRREHYVETIIGRYPVLPFDLPVARVHARLSADLAAQGQMIGAHDLIIAATASAHGLAVMTHNQRHFGRIRGLDVRQA